uniref:Glypican-1 n=1 Tax=Canis lupus familiaris TaxID=9615 RepID=A0A8P0SH92_CANLF
MEPRARGWWLLCAAAALAACARGDPASKGRSCSEVRQVYGAKGFSLSDVPQAEISGEHLRICPQGYTCCTSEMEENLANRSRAELETALLDSAHALQATLATQLQSFDDHFQQLLNESERALQDAFPGAFGELYTQGAKAFRDLYAELRLYYRGANLHLEDTLAEFWARLLERLFRQLHPQLLLPDDYLDCLGKQADALRPFGEAPRELRLRATRAFVAARAFVQGLGVAGDVVRKVAQVPLGPECSRAVMKLAYCAHCLGVPGARPCPDYCRNVLKGCLANQADLDAEWRNLLDSMVLITDKFWGPSGAESVIGGVHLWLAEAINALQDNRDILTAKVIQGCGNPKVNPQGSGPEEKRRQGKLVLQEKPPTGTLEKLVSEAKTQLRDAQDFWISLPGMLCSEKMAMSSASDDRCWNGMAKGRYLPEVMGDGLANQINNPEVEVDITKPDMTVRQQIMQLKVMTNRLRGAYSGNDVDFQDASDDSSGARHGPPASLQARRPERGPRPPRSRSSDLLNHGQGHPPHGALHRAGGAEGLALQRAVGLGALLQQVLGQLDGVVVHADVGLEVHLLAARRAPVRTPRHANHPLLQVADAAPRRHRLPLLRVAPRVGGLSRRLRARGEAVLLAARHHGPLLLAAGRGHPLLQTGLLGGFGE